MKNLLLLLVVLLTLSTCKKEEERYCFDCTVREKVKISYLEEAVGEIPEGYEICDGSGEYVCYMLDDFEVCNETEGNIKYLQNQFTFSNENGESSMVCNKRE